MTKNKLSSLNFSVWNTSSLNYAPFFTRPFCYGSSYTKLFVAQYLKRYLTYIERLFCNSMHLSEGIKLGFCFLKTVAPFFSRYHDYFCLSFKVAVRLFSKENKERMMK